MIVGERLKRRTYLTRHVPHMTEHLSSKCLLTIIAFDEEYCRYKSSFFFTVRHHDELLSLKY